MFETLVQIIVGAVIGWAIFSVIMSIAYPKK